MNNQFKIVLAIFCLLSFGGYASASSTITVCSSGCDYTSIQSAIDGANTGDTIKVYSGTYYEHVNVNKKVILKGIGLPVVDAGGTGSAITLSTYGIYLDGFSATNSGSSLGDAGIKVTGISNSNTLTNNTVNNNQNGIWLDFSMYNTLTNNIVNYNSDIGIYICRSSFNTLYNNDMNNNTNHNAYEDSDHNINYWNKNHYSGFDEPSEGCYDANNDNVCDSSYSISGGSSIDYYPLVSWIALTPPTTPVISISTDKTTYTAGDKMQTSLEITNNGDTGAFDVYVWLELPNGDRHWVIELYPVTLPSGLDWKKDIIITLPNIPSGNYTWHGEIIQNGQVVSGIIAAWNFIGIAASENKISITKYLKNIELE